VLTTTNAPEAHVALAALDSAGIDAVIRGEHMGALPAGPIARPSVWVRDEDYIAACEVLGVPAEEKPADSSDTSSAMLRVMIVIVAVLLILILLQR
jgi:hypothetical protein